MSIYQRYTKEELEAKSNKETKGTKNLDEWFSWALNSGATGLKDFSVGNISIVNDGKVVEKDEKRTDAIADALLEEFKRQKIFNQTGGRVQRQPCIKQANPFPIDRLQAKKEKKGLKFSDDKAPMGKLLKQFPLAFEQVAFRTKVGHEKYNIDGADDDWKNFTRVENANYEDAAIRHFCGLGEENEIEHMAASIWNQLAELQLKLENNE